MHIPDGIINGATSAGYGALALGGLGVALRRTREYLGERQVPLAALVAAFVFAAQMVDFPIVAGMSGHLLGGVLAAVLVGPAAAVVILTVVLIVQAFLFADGGLTALGLNIFNIALVGAIGGYALFRIVVAILPNRDASVTAAAAIAAFVSVPLAAAGFVLQYVVGGVTAISTGTLLAAMLGSHALIGIGEALITGFVVAGVLAARPDLVFGRRTVAAVAS